MHVATQQRPCGDQRGAAIAICAGARKIGFVNANVWSAGSCASSGARMGALLLVLALPALTVPATCAGAEEQEPVAAVWKEHKLHFSYVGFATVHSCFVLQNRIARVLNAIGARPDLEVTLMNCDAPITSSTVVAGGGAGWPQNPTGSSSDGWPAVPSHDGARWPSNAPRSGSGTYRRTEPRQMVDVQVRMSMPAEMTPAVIADLKADRKRRELIAHVTGDPLPLFDDPIAFAAKRKVVTLSHETTGIEAVDCELLDQMASSVFRTLGARVVRRGFTCDRISVSRIRPTLDVEALVPVAFLAASNVGTSVSGDDQPEPRETEVSAEEPARNDADRQPK